MNKIDFLRNLESKLVGYEKRKEVIAFYNEIINDRVRAGQNESDVITSFGSVDEIAYKIMGKKQREKICYTERFDGRSVHVDNTSYSEAKEKNVSSGKEKLCVWKIVLFVLLAPMLISLAMGIISSIWGVSVGFLGGGFAGFIGSMAVGLANAFTFAGPASLGQISLCLIGVGIGLLLIFIGINIMVFFVKLLISFVKWFVNLFKVGGFFYES